jgi:hypothetical protein
MVSRIALTMLDIFSAAARHLRNVRGGAYLLIDSYQIVDQFVRVKIILLPLSTVLPLGMAACSLTSLFMVFVFSFYFHYIIISRLSGVAHDLFVVLHEVFIVKECILLRLICIR